MNNRQKYINVITETNALCFLLLPAISLMSFSLISAGVSHRGCRGAACRLVKPTDSVWGNPEKVDKVCNPLQRKGQIQHCPLGRISLLGDRNNNLKETARE